MTDDGKQQSARQELYFSAEPVTEPESFTACLLRWTDFLCYEYLVVHYLQFCRKRFSLFTKKILKSGFELDCSGLKLLSNWQRKGALLGHDK